jgi:carbonic anhydrase
MDIDEIIQRLKEGNKRFIADKLDGMLQNANLREELSEGQSPYAIVLGCADSRVIPELIFDTGLGELFTVRVAGNVANPASIASIEYAVAQLKSKVVIVMGHENCGAVAAAVKGGDAGYHLNLLLAHITPAVESVQSGELNDMIKKNAEISASQLESRSPILSAAVKSGQIRILPAYYHLTKGEVEFL